MPMEVNLTSAGVDPARGGRSNSRPFTGSYQGATGVMFRQSRREPIDGIDTLRRRERTRLWYRQPLEPVVEISPLEAVAQANPVSAVRIVASQPVGTDRLVRE